MSKLSKFSKKLGEDLARMDALGTKVPEGSLSRLVDASLEEARRAWRWQQEEPLTRLMEELEFWVGVWGENGEGGEALPLYEGLLKAARGGADFPEIFTGLKETSKKLHGVYPIPIQLDPYSLYWTDQAEEPTAQRGDE